MRTTKVLRETVIFFWEAKAKLPTRPSPKTLYRWRDRGKRSVFHDEPVKLEWCDAGPGCATSLEAYHRFMGRVNGELPLVAEPARRKAK